MKNQIETLTNLLEPFNVESVELIHDDTHKDVIKIKFYKSELPLYIVANEFTTKNSQVNEVVEIFEGILENNPDYKAAMNLKDGLQWALGREE